MIQKEKWFFIGALLALYFCIVWYAYTQRVAAWQTEQPCTTACARTATPITTPEARSTPAEENTESQPPILVVNEYHPATCTGEYPDKPILQGFAVINETTDRYSWWPSVNADKYAVVYGYSPDALIYGVDNISKDTTSIVLGNLQPNTQSWAQVWAYKGECVTRSDIVN